MVEFRLVIADPKTGKCIQKTATDAKNLIGLRIGDTIKGETINLQGYEFMITGGSDYCGFPMKKGIISQRKRILTEKGVGFRGGRKGMKRRKTVCGEKIDEKVTQINLKITKYGNKPLTSEEGKTATAEKQAEATKTPEKPEAPKEEKKQETKEEKQAEKKEE